MKKIIETETFLAECPNCGAARVGEERTCRFCNSSLSVKQLVSESLEAEPSDVSTHSGAGAGTTADIESKVKPAFWSDRFRVFCLCASGLLLVLAVLACIAAGKRIEDSEKVWKDPTETVDPMFASFSSSLGADLAYDYKVQGIRLYFAGALFTALSIGLFAYTAFPVIRYRKLLKNGRKYSAEVVSNTTTITGTNNVYSRRIPGTEYRVKVKAYIDGREMTVLLPMPQGSSSGDYPRGKRVEICVLGNDAVLCG